MADSRHHNCKLPPEQQAIRDKCFHPSGTFVEFPIEDVESSIPARFEKMVRAYPNRLAIKTAIHELTFAQLNDAANRVANAILEKLGAASEPVALLFEQGAAAIIAILGVLKAGKIYVPLDPAQPAERCKDAVADSTAGLIVTHTAHLTKAQQLAAAGSHLLNFDALELKGLTANPQLPIAPDTLAYIVYTSGSSGRPKGVAHEHRYVLYHAFEFNHCFHLCAADRCVLISPWNFSGGGHIIHTTLLNGAALFPLDVKAMGMEQVVRSIIENRITIYHSTPTVLRQLVNVLQPGERLPDVRLLRFGGEALSAADLLVYNEHFPDDCLALNGLASTECGIVSRYFLDKHASVGGNQPPAGYAAYGKEILLLDDNGDPVDVGETGEIAVKGRYLASGYWKQPELTAAKFLATGDGDEEKIYLTGDLGRVGADGYLYHLGRKDFQVKIRGYRIEVAEVEAALRQQEAIKDAAVVARAEPGGEAHLIAYVIRTGNDVTSVSEIRNRLRRLLPDYMIPAAFVFLEEFPLTPTGKIDRRSLPDPGHSRPKVATPYEAPRTFFERGLAGIYAEVLGVERVGIHDNFFDLGGHSLLLVRLHSRIKTGMGRAIPWAAFLRASTIAEIAEVLESGAAAPNHSTLIPIRPEGSRPPFFCAHGAWGSVVFGLELARRLDADQPFYGLQAPGLDGEREPFTRIEDMAAHHIREIQRVQRVGPYFLGGLSMGGLVALEIAQQLSAQREEVALLCLLDTSLLTSRHLIDRWGSRARRLLVDEIFGRAVFHGRNLLQQRRSYAQAKTRLLGKRMAAKLRLDHQGIQAHLSDVYAVKVRKANMEATRHYQARPYAGAATLLMTSASATGKRYDSHKDWRQLALGGLDIQLVPGDHSTMIGEENIGAFAETLCDCLRRAQAVTNGSDESLEK